MRRADRLFQIIQMLRVRLTTTAAELAHELEVSERTVYRDIRDLILSGVPIQGEAGVGYALPRGFDLPPLMFSADEVEALVVGVRMVEAWCDPSLARMARSVLDKTCTVLPERLRERLQEVDVYAPGFHVPAEQTRNLQPLRAAVSSRRKVRFHYTDGDGAATRRTVRPLGLFFWGTAWTAVGWCELRSDFRSFRPDRMSKLEVLDVPFAEEKGRDLETFLSAMRDALRER